MAANTGERTLIPAVIPPGAAHIHGVSSISHENPWLVALIGGLTASILHDFAVRVAPKSTISGSTVCRLPLIDANHISHEIVERSLRLNCLTSAYAPLWEALTGNSWSPKVPLRKDAERYDALLEIDVLVALGLGVMADELMSIYFTQFPVLAGYDRNQYVFDSSGRLVPNEILTQWRHRGQNEGSYSSIDLSATHPSSGVLYTYEIPFRTRDRAAETAETYIRLERRFASRSENSR